MIYKNDDLLIKEEPKVVIKYDKLINDINNRRFYVYINSKPWSGFDSLSVWNDSIYFYRKDTVKHPLTSDDIKKETNIELPVEQCFDMVLSCGDDNIKLSDYKDIEERCKIKKILINAGDFVRLTYKNNDANIEYTSTAVVFEVDARRIILSIPCGESLRHIYLTTDDLLRKTVSVEIEVLFKAEPPIPWTTPSNEDDDDDSPKYDVIDDEEED